MKIKESQLRHIIKESVLKILKEEQKRGLNENLNNLKQSRFEGLVGQIDYYSWIDHDKGQLSKEQLQHLAELRDTMSVFGENGMKWAGLATEILEKYGIQ